MWTPDTWHLTPDMVNMTCDTCDTCDTWHVTHDMWHMTCDTCDTWHVTHGGVWTFPSSLALTVWDRQCLKHSERKDHRLNESINELMTKVFIEQPWLHRVCLIYHIMKRAPFLTLLPSPDHVENGGRGWGSCTWRTRGQKYKASWWCQGTRPWVGS